MGSYRIVKKLATGGMSEVFLGQECGPEASGRMVALKRLLPMYQREAHQVEQFLREARVCQGFRHPNVVPVLEVGVSQERLYTVMELVEGESLNVVLRAHLQRNERMRLTEACYVVRQVAEGLAYAHALRAPSGQPLGLIHRDINPSNVLLSRTGEVKLVDFGIAKVADGSRDTQAGLIKGKLRYLSPEQARGERLDQRSDVFLLGVLLYELLTGRHLFDGTDLELLQQITRFDEDRLEPVAWVPRPLWRVLQRTLAASRLVRMGTARELADTLSAFLEEWELSLGPIDMAQVFARCFPQWHSPLQGPHDCDTLVCLKSHAPPVLSEEPFSLVVDVCEEAEARTCVLPLPPRPQPESSGGPPVPSLPRANGLQVASRRPAVPVLQEEPRSMWPRRDPSQASESAIRHAIQRSYRGSGPERGASREDVSALGLFG